MVRSANPLGFGAPSLETSFQTQIDDLVQRNRTLEHTNKKLADQIALEKAKANEATAEVQKQWKQDQLEWREGCDVLQSCHRVVQLRNVVLLEQERMNILKEQDVTRKEKLLRLQRDFRITMFQAREADLEDKIRDLEEHRDALSLDIEELVGQRDQQASEFLAQLKAKEEEVALMEEDKEQIQNTLTKLREQYSRRESDSEKLLRELERVTLQRDSSATTRDELKRANEELARSKAELLSQLDKWQSLEKRGEADAAAERDKRVQLDIQVQELQAQLESVGQEHEKQLRKEQRKVEKLRESNETLQTDSEKHEEEIEMVNRKLAKAERKIAKLQAALEAERARTRSPSPDSSNQIVEPSQASKAPIKASTQPIRKNASKKTQPTDDTGKAAGKTKHKATRSDAEEIPDAEPSDIEEQPQKNSKGKGKSKGTEPAEVQYLDTEEKPQKSLKGKGKAKAIEENDEILEIGPPQVPPKARRKNKRKLEEEERNEENHEDVEEVPPPKKLKQASNSKTRETDVAVNSGQRKPPSRMRSASVQLGATKEASDTEQEAAKKKRRKINIFPTSAVPFTFESGALGGNGSGLNIPTVLSPVKESDNVPNRSNSIVGTIGSMLKSSFTSRR
ncbi:hypothetical protein H0H93_009195 [Arthromyces matolae]|nr:hypothetical protein H0H93_009195 [Arthromyces matolae]